MARARRGDRSTRDRCCAGPPAARWAVPLPVSALVFVSARGLSEAMRRGRRGEIKKRETGAERQTGVRGGRGGRGNIRKHRVRRLASENTGRCPRSRQHRFADGWVSSATADGTLLLKRKKKVRPSEDSPVHGQTAADASSGAQLDAAVDGRTVPAASAAAVDATPSKEKPSAGFPFAKKPARRTNRPKSTQEARTNPRTFRPRSPEIARRCTGTC